MDNDIKAFVHCRRCVSEHRSSDIDVGLVTSTVLRVWCNRHKILIHDFALATAMPVRCDVCGEEIKEGHKH